MFRKKFAAALVCTAALMGSNPPVSASSDGGPLVLKEDPAKAPELLALLEKFKKKEAMERLPTLAAAQKIRIGEYYGLAKANGKVTDREISSGISSMVRGYWEIGEVRKFAESYAQTGKLPKGLPTPNASFLTAAEKFPGAADFLKEEIDGTKALDEQIGTILEQAALNADKRAAEADKRAAEAERRGAEADRRAAEAERRGAEADRRAADADRRAAEYRKQTEALERILKLLK